MPKRKRQSFPTDEWMEVQMLADAAAAMPMQYTCDGKKRDKTAYRKVVSKAYEHYKRAMRCPSRKPLSSLQAAAAAKHAVAKLSGLVNLDVLLVQIGWATFDAFPVAHGVLVEQ